MPTYTVERAEKSDVWTATEGKAAGQQFQGWALTLIDGNGSYEAQANTRLGNDFPGVGEKVDGDLIPGPRGVRFKRAFSGSGGGGSNGYKRDPRETASIVRQHSQHMAILWAAILQKASPDIKPSYEWLKGITDWFFEDAREASK